MYNSVQASLAQKIVNKFLLRYLPVFVQVQLLQQLLNLVGVRPWQQRFQLIFLYEACFVGVKVVEGILQGLLSPEFGLVYHRSGELVEADLPGLVFVYFGKDELDILDVEFVFLFKGLN